MALKNVCRSLVILSLVVFGGAKTAKTEPIDIWDVHKDIKIHGILSLNEFGPLVLSRPRTIGIKVSEDAVPEPAGNEGCMCTYLNEPPNIARAISRLFKTEEVLFDKADDAGLPQARKDASRPVITMSFEPQSSYINMDISVTVGQKDVAHFQAKIRPALVYDPQLFRTRQNKSNVGFAGLLWQTLRGALTRQPKLENSAVYSAVEEFLKACEKP